MSINLSRYLVGLLILATFGCQQHSVKSSSANLGAGEAKSLLTLGVNRGVLRGVIECADDDPCRIPRHELIANAIHPRDLEVQFMRLPYDGPPQLLNSGVTMGSNERFTIYISAKVDAHLYLFHKDRKGRIVDLVGASQILGIDDCRTRNLLKAGQEIQLPASGEHYSLDGITGDELVHAVASRTPICGAVNWPVQCDGKDRICASSFVIRHLKEI